MTAVKDENMAEILFYVRVIPAVVKRIAAGNIDGLPQDASEQIEEFVVRYVKFTWWLWAALVKMITHGRLNLPLPKIKPSPLTYAVLAERDEGGCHQYQIRHHFWGILWRDARLFEKV